MSDDEDANPFGDGSPVASSSGGGGGGGGSISASTLDKLSSLRAQSLVANSGAVGGGGGGGSSGGIGGGSAAPADGAAGGARLAAASVPIPQPSWQSCGMQLCPDFASDVTFDESTGLESEIQVFEKVRCMVRFANGDRVLGNLSASTYQLRFRPDGPLPVALRHLAQCYFSVPIASIRKLEKITASANAPWGVEVVCKDSRSLLLGFENEATAEMIHVRIKMVAFPQKIEFLFAFLPKAKPAPLPGWEVYSPAQEIARLGITALRHPVTGEPLYRVSDTNRDFGFCSTYPATLVFPARASDAFMGAVAEFRSKARVPALTWLHPAAKTSLWRCSQPKVGMGNKKCREDEELLQLIRDNNLFTKAGPKALLLVADCRPQTNARANLAMGGGYENYPGTQLEFCNIHNIHAVRDAHRAVERLCLSGTPRDQNWSGAVAETQWLTHLRAVLAAGMRCAEAMHREGQSVLVHCSDGWDRTAQVSSLVQIFLDPYARTLRGMCSLIAKEWCSFGHKFGERAGHMLDKDDSDISPVFIQFLDALWQLVRLYPHAFEFNARLPLLLAHHLYSCRFGTFLCCNDKERREFKLAHKTPSLWAYILECPAVTEALRSRDYDPSAGDVLLPFYSSVLRQVTLWSDWFLRFSPFPSIPSTCAAMETYPEAQYSRAALQAARLPPRAASGSGSAGSGGASSSAAAAVAAAAPAAPAAGGGGGSGLIIAPPPPSESSAAAKGEGSSPLAAPAPAPAPAPEPEPAAPPPPPATVLDTQGAGAISEVQEGVQAAPPEGEPAAGEASSSAWAATGEEEEGSKTNKASLFLGSPEAAVVQEAQGLEDV